MEPLSGQDSRKKKIPLYSSEPAVQPAGCDCMICLFVRKKKVFFQIDFAFCVC